jgi:hypothetical protein
MQGLRERVNTCRDRDGTSDFNNFCPSAWMPDRLVLREDNVKVTLSLSSDRWRFSSAPPASAAYPISA